MNLQSIVNDVKSRVDTLAAQGQEVVKTLPGTLKQANEILVQGVQTLVKTETESAKDLLASAKASFEKAKADGIKAVVANPVGYLPETDKLLTVFNQTVSVVSKTGDDLYKTIKSTFVSPTAEVKAEVEAVAKAATKKVKKAATSAKKAAKTTH